MANAISFGLEYHDSTYQVVGSDTYNDLVLEFQSGTLLSTQTIVSLDSVTSTAYAGTSNDYPTLITTTFIAGITGIYEFQVGTDWPGSAFRHELARCPRSIRARQPRGLSLKRVCYKSATLTTRQRGSG